MIEAKGAIERIIKLIEERDAAIDRFISLRGEICFEAPCGWRDDQYLVARPCTHPGHEAEWQASFFDDQGASGQVITHYRGLIKEVVTYYNLDLTRITRIGRSRLTGRTSLNEPGRPMSHGVVAFERCAKDVFVIRVNGGSHRPKGMRRLESIANIAPFHSCPYTPQVELHHLDAIWSSSKDFERGSLY
jgi:hypothetical protein